MDYGNKFFKIKKALFIALILIVGTQYATAQVKIGDDPEQIDVASILELESNSRAFVPTRVTNAEMNNIFPLNGALVYNTDAKCIFVFEGAVWKSLCGAGIEVTLSASVPTGNLVGDLWINTEENKTRVWNGTDWVLISANTKSGAGVPSLATVTNAIAGDIYVNTTDGTIFSYTGTNWVNNSSTSPVSNGLNRSGSDEIELGGALTKPTVIESNTTNTLALEGLSAVDDNSNMVVTIDTVTSILSRTAVSSLVQKQEVVIMANNGQNQFNTPLTITNEQKIDVYRNGVKISFTTIGTNTIELEINVICYQNDEIRIVQFF